MLIDLQCVLKTHVLYVKVQDEPHRKAHPSPASIQWQHTCCGYANERWHIETKGLRGVTQQRRIILTLKRQTKWHQLSSKKEVAGGVNRLVLQGEGDIYELPAIKPETNVKPILNTAKVFTQINDFTTTAWSWWCSRAVRGHAMWKGIDKHDWNLFLWHVRNVRCCNTT